MLRPGRDGDTSDKSVVIVAVRRLSIELTVLHYGLAHLNPLPERHSSNRYELWHQRAGAQF
jgi:hypothetical protein